LPPATLTPAYGFTMDRLPPPGCRLARFCCCCRSCVLVLVPPWFLPLIIARALVPRRASPRLPAVTDYLPFPFPATAVSAPPAPFTPLILFLPPFSLSCSTYRLIACVLPLQLNYTFHSAAPFLPLADFPRYTVHRSRSGTFCVSHRSTLPAATALLRFSVPRLPLLDTSPPACRVWILPFCRACLLLDFTTNLLPFPTFCVLGFLRRFRRHIP